MFKKLPLALSFLSIASQAAVSTHLRAGIDFTAMKLDIDSTIAVPLTPQLENKPLPHFTAEIRKPLDNSYSIGILGSLTPFFIGKQTYYALKTGVTSYLNKGDNAIGLGFQIHHVPLENIDPSFTGYLNNTSLSIAMQGSLHQNIYAHFEIRKDITPIGSKSWEIFGVEDEMYSLAIQSATFNHFASSFSIGYILPSDI